MEKVFIINSECFGKGDEALGKKLMGSFLRKLWVKEDKPEAILFYNSGVKLLTKESNCLDALDGLYTSGVDLIACGTCVDYYEIKDKFVLGRVSNMEDIVDHMMVGKVVVTV